MLSGYPVKRLTAASHVCLAPVLAVRVAVVLSFGGIEPFVELCSGMRAEVLKIRVNETQNAENLSLCALGAHITRIPTTCLWHNVK